MGRPKKRWLDNVREDCKILGLTVEEVQINWRGTGRDGGVVSQGCLSAVDLSVSHVRATKSLNLKTCVNMVCCVFQLMWINFVKNVFNSTFFYGFLYQKNHVWNFIDSLQLTPAGNSEVCCYFHERTVVRIDYGNNPWNCCRFISRDYVLMVISWEATIANICLFDVPVS